MGLVRVALGLMLCALGPHAVFAAPARPLSFDPGFFVSLINQETSGEFNSVGVSDEQPSGSATVSFDGVGVDGVSPFRGAVRAEPGSIGLRVDGVPNTDSRVSAVGNYTDDVTISAPGATGFGMTTFDYEIEGTIDFDSNGGSNGVFIVLDFALPDGGLTSLPPQLEPSVTILGFDSVTAIDLMVTPAPNFVNGFIGSAFQIGIIDDPNTSVPTDFSGTLRFEIPFLFGETLFSNLMVNAETTGPDFVDVFNSADLVRVLVEQGESEVPDASVTGIVGGDLMAVAEANTADVPLPAGLPLLLAGLAALGLYARRKT